MTERVVIVGAGVLGAAIGWRIAEAGHHVTLVDPTPGGLASPGSFAWLNACSSEDPVYNRLRHDSLELWAAMKRADPNVPVTFAGSIMWEQDDFDLAAIEESQGILGRPAETIDGPTIAARVPALKTVPDHALSLPGDGYGEPEAIVTWFLHQGALAGAELIAEKVEEVRVERGAIIGVRTEAQTIAADHVVFAAGVELRQLLAPLDLDVAMQNEPGLLARTSPGSSTIDTMLVTADVHIWQRADDGFLIGADFGGGDSFERPDEDAARVLADLQAVLGGTEDCSIEAVTVRERPKPFDGRPAIGPLGPRGLYVVSTHSGMTLAPVIAECVAREIAGGSLDPRLAPYRPGRAALRRSGQRPQG